MNKNQCNKLKFMLTGIQSRLEENLSFFKEMEFSYKSGKKSYGGKVTLEDGAFRLFFNGESKTMNTDALFSFFVQEGAKYESFTLFYRERGYQMELMADEKNIKTKKTEEKQEVVMDNPLLKNREYIIRPSQAPDLLKAIGIMTAEGKIKNDMIRKYNQIDRFIELIAPLFPADNDKELTVIDCC